MICLFLWLSPSCHFCLTRKGVLTLFSPSGMTSSCVHSVASMFEVMCNISQYFSLLVLLILFHPSNYSVSQPVFLSLLCLPALATAVFMYLEKPKTFYHRVCHLCLCLQKILPLAETNISLQNRID